jgi:hypothetical protein
MTPDNGHLDSSGQDGKLDRRPFPFLDGRDLVARTGRTPSGIAAKQARQVCQEGGLAHDSSGLDLQVAESRSCLGKLETIHIDCADQGAMLFMAECNNRIYDERAAQRQTARQDGHTDEQTDD